MYHCNNYGWNPYQAYSAYGDEDSYISAPKCMNLPKNVNLCYNPITFTATLSYGGNTLATGKVNLITKSVTLKGQLGDISANVTLKVTDLKDFCGNISGQICKGSKCKTFNANGLCLK